MLTWVMQDVQERLRVGKIQVNKFESFFFPIWIRFILSCETVSKWTSYAKSSQASNMMEITLLSFIQSIFNEE